MSAAHWLYLKRGEDLVREGRRSGGLTRAICAQLFELLLLKIEDAAVQGDSAQENFQRCKALIDAEAERLMTLREIAAAVGLEESSVCRLFRRYPARALTSICRGER